MMSSNNLNYELSKQLKELGVEFENISTQFNNQKGEIIDSPTTAQLINEIAKRTWFDLSLDEDAHEFDIDVLHAGVVSDPCCTTALGKALINLVKNEKENGR